MFFVFILLHCSVSAQFKNILIDSIGDPNEVSIAIDFNSPNFLVAGAKYRREPGTQFLLQEL